jgi:hypothetical protein
MPSVPMRWLIVLGWLATTAWWFVRDVAPWLGADKLGYRQLLAKRASDESSNWRILVDGKQVGSILSSVHPRTNGAFSFWSQAILKSSLISNAMGVGVGGDGELSLQLSAEVSPLGRLTSFEVRMSLRSDVGAGAEFGGVKGTVEGEELVIQPVFVNSQPFGQPIRVRFDPATPITGEFSPTDKIPGLWVGRKWTTRVIDPQAVLLGGGILKSGPPTREVMHSVVGSERIIWNEKAHDCFVVEDRHADKQGKTWVRISDGLVLRQESNLGRSTIVMELDPKPMQQARMDSQ